MPALIVDPTCASDDAMYQEVDEEFMLLGHFRPVRGCRFPAQTAINLGQFPNGVWRERILRSTHIGAIVDKQFAWTKLDIGRNGALVAYCRVEAEEIFLSATFVTRPPPFEGPPIYFCLPPSQPTPAAAS